MATSLETYTSALKPYIGSVYQQLANTGNGNYAKMLAYDHTQFDPNFSVQLMDHYNRSMNLGLTDQQIVDGINAFAQRSAKQWNMPKPLASDSNPVAVAAESIERALALAGKDSGAFWNVASKDLNKGQELADQMYRYGMAQSGQEYMANNDDDDDGFLDKVVNVVKAVAPIGFGMIPGVGGILMGAAHGALSSAAQQNSFDNLLKDAGIGALGGFIGKGISSGFDGSLFGDAATGAAGSTTGATTGAAAGSGGTGMFDDIFSWLSDTFGGATDAASGWDFGPLSDTVLNGGVDAASGLNLDQMVNYMSSGWDFGPLSDSLINGGVDPVSGMTLDQMKPGLLDAVKNYLTQNPGSTLKTAAQALLGGGSGGGLLGGTGTGQGSLLGAILGGLAGSYGGAKQDGTINTTQTPWGPQQPYLLDAWEKAKQASNNPINTQAQSNYQSVLQGPTTNPYLGMDNPYLQKQIDNTNADVTRAMMPAMNQANKASGSFGNSGVADIYSKNMTDAYSRNANDMRFKDYYAQMQLQKDAVNNTLGFTQGSSAFNAAPAQDYAKTVQGNYGGTKSEPYFTNPASSILGGATLGYNLFGR